MRETPLEKMNRDGYSAREATLHYVECAAEDTDAIVRELRRIKESIHKHGLTGSELEKVWTLRRQIFDLRDDLENRAKELDDHVAKYGDSGRDTDVQKD